MTTLANRPNTALLVIDVRHSVESALAWSQSTAGGLTVSWSTVATTR